MFTLERISNQNHRAEKEFSESVPETNVFQQKLANHIAGQSGPRLLCTYSSTGTSHSPLFTLIYGCFHVPEADSSRYSRDCRPHEA